MTMKIIPAGRVPRPAGVLGIYLRAWVFPYIMQVFAKNRRQYEAGPASALYWNYVDKTKIGMSKYSCSEEYFEDYGVSEGFCCQKVDEIMEYVRERGLRAPSNDIPDDLLMWWQFVDLPEPEELDRMEQVEKHRRGMCCWLVFVQMLDRVRLIHQLLTNEELTHGDIDLLLERQAFLLRYILVARRKGWTIPDFDVLEVDRLPEFIEMVGGYEVLDGIGELD